MPKSPGKDIVLMIDGTRQGPEDPQSIPTNVEGLAYYFNAPSIRRADKVARPINAGIGLRSPAWTDVAGYLSGIGAETMHVPRWLPAASGAGMAHMIRLAYKFLCQHYVPGDRIFLLGFSRGAFAARSLAGFVDCVGIALRALPPAYMDRVIDEAYFIYEFLDGDVDALRDGITHHLKGSMRDVLAKTVLEWSSLPIYFIGIWDAVEALGFPSEAAVLTRSFNSYHQTRLPPNVTHASHALALHELRTDYRPHLWRTKLPQQNLTQRWFPGDHCDVGGGHESRGLASRCFSWMLSQARAAGLPGLDLLINLADAQSASADYLQQMWQRLPFNLLPPRIREEVLQFAEDPKVLVLGHEIDTSAFDRLAIPVRDDYARFSADAPFWQPPRLQIDLLKQIDEMTKNA